MSGVGGHKSLLDLILEQEENINGLLDVNAFRGSGGGISDNQLIVVKIRCLRKGGA